MTLTRRRLLMASGAAALGASAMSRTLLGAPAQGDRKKILYFTKSSGFQHSVIARDGDNLAHSEKILIELGKEHGFDVTASKDGRLLDPDRIDEWDAFVFYTTGDLTTPGTDGTPPMSPEGRDALLDAIRSGRKGFAGIHCGTDTFHSPAQGPPTPYIEMIGAEFISHGPQQVATVKVVDQDFPGAGAFGSMFEINDEWYAFRNMSDQIHAIMVQVTEGMRSGGRNDYERPDYPNTWVKTYGDGRVFYTSMGHREDVWTNPKYQGLLIGGLNVITGRADADFTPNVEKVTPGYQTLPG